MDAIARAAEALRGATALWIGAGAGMGVDSGLPDFRGPEGFWRAYPPYRHLGLSFSDLANPRWFASDPAFAWGFYGHRLELYRRTVPHAGFAVLRRLAAGRSSFVFTSNVDGQFQRAGFDDEQVFECHGSIHHLQCLADCGAGIFPAEGPVAVDPETFRAAPPFPSCPSCGGLARPNILMFGDWGWDADRTQGQEACYRAWRDELPGRGVVAIECGAGTAIPSVRHEAEALVRRAGATLIRINVREPEVPSGQIGLPMGAKAALEAIAGAGA